MKLGSKIAVSAALLGAFTTANAEAITFGVEIPPIASINVSQGLLVTAKALQATTPATLVPGDAPFVGAFTVNTNMPKWNVYFNLANNGYLVDQSGNYLKSTAVANNFLGLGINSGDGTGAGKVWLKFPATSNINGYTDAADAADLIVADATVFNLTTEGIINNTTNTLTKSLATGDAAACTGGVCVDQGWIFATAPTTTTIVIGTAIDNAAPVNAIAGTYTETLYLTLVTAY